MQTDNRYVSHKIFEEIENYASFYESLSFSVMRWASTGTTAIISIDTYVLSSIQGTLDSIGLILLQGRINDAYALLRKYYDSIIINAYEIAYLEDHSNIETFIVEKINNWLHGKEKLPSYRDMNNYLKNCTRLKSLTSLLKMDKGYVELRSRCNDHMHYNFFRHMFINDNKVYNPNRNKYLDRFQKDMRDLFIMHFSYLFILRPHYMSSGDYVDALDCDLIPEEGSEYFVAPFIQEVFDSVLKEHRQDIAALIKETTFMKLE